MKIIIEVGANLGNDTERLGLDDNTIVYAFEPTPDLALYLKNRFKDKNNINIIEKAIDQEEGESIFNIAGTSDWGCSSLHEFTDNIHDIWNGRPDFHFTNKCLVQKIRLDSFIISNKIEKIDYLWIDAQGNDFRVLKSLGEKINIVKEGKCEAAYTVSLYKNIENSVESITNWLSLNNFDFTIIPDSLQKEADIHFKNKRT